MRLPMTIQDSIGQLTGSGHLGEKAIVSGMIAVDVVQAVDDEDRAASRLSELGTGRVELVGDLLTEPRDIVARQLPVTSRASIRVQHDDQVVEERLRRATRSRRCRARNIGIVAKNPIGAARKCLTQKRGFPAPGGPMTAT